MNKKIYKLHLIILFLFTIILPFPQKVFSLDFSAYAYILYCPDNEKVILEKNANKKLPIASTTKIMTALLALETSKLYDENVKITEEMIRVEGSSMGLRKGQVLPISSLAKGALTVSGNDAANSIAICLGGDFKNFSRLMNIRAKELKMNNTNFVTPSGLDEKNHYSTAYDMAILASEAMKNKEFLKVVSNLKTDVTFKEPNKIIPFYNENKLLKKYKGCIGIKTGFTKASGRCLVSCAEKENLRLIAVTLNAPDDWNDHIKLFDYGFSNFKYIVPKKENFSIPVIGGTEDSAELIFRDPVKIILKTNENPKITSKINIQKFIYAPTKKNKIAGEITYFLDGKKYKKYELVTKKEIPRKNKKLSFLEKIKNIVKNMKNKIIKKK